MRCEPWPSSCIALVSVPHGAGLLRFTNHTIWDLHGLTALVRLSLAADTPEFAQWQGPPPRGSIS